MNEKILNKLDEIEQKNSIDTGLKTVKYSSDAPMTYTPVNKETFAKWCQGYMEKLQKVKQERMTEKDLKPTGREIFDMSKKDLNNIKLDDIDKEDEEGSDDEEFKDEEAGDDEDDGGDEPLYYDTALYNAQDLEEEVDFD